MNEWGLYPDWVENTGPDPWGAIPVTQLTRQSFVESQHSGLRSAVVYILSVCSKTRHTGDGDYMSMVILHEVGHEFFRHEKVGLKVDAQSQIDPGFGLIQNTFSHPNTSVVNNDRRLAMTSANLLGDLVDLFRVGDI